MRAAGAAHRVPARPSPSIRQPAPALRLRRHAPGPVSGLLAADAMHLSPGASGSASLLSLRHPPPPRDWGGAGGLTDPAAPADCRPRDAPPGAPGAFARRAAGGGGGARAPAGNRELDAVPTHVLDHPRREEPAARHGGADPRPRAPASMDWSGRDARGRPGPALRDGPGRGLPAPRDALRGGVRPGPSSFWIWG